MANQPASTTVAKVASLLGAVPRSVSNLGNEANLSPSTVRKCLAALAERGEAVRSEQSGEWTRPAAPAPIKEPTALTKSALGKLSRDELVAWATSCSLLEHLSEDDLAALGTKAKVVDEVMGALLRAEVAEDHRAAATDETARPLAELIGFEPATQPAKPAKAAKKAAKAAPKPDEVPNPLEGVAAKLAALGLSDKLARHDAQLVELLAEHGPLTKAQVEAKLPGLSAWAFRRMSEGKHSDRSFSPLLSVTGQGKARTYTLAQAGRKVVGS